MAPVTFFGVKVEGYGQRIFHVAINDSTANGKKRNAQDEANDDDWFMKVSQAARMENEMAKIKSFDKALLQVHFTRIGAKEAGDRAASFAHKNTLGLYSSAMATFMLYAVICLLISVVAFSDAVYICRSRKQS